MARTLDYLSTRKLATEEGKEIRRLQPGAAKEMDYVVDVQGFQMATGEFIFKEVAVVGLPEGSLPSVYLFQPPVSWVNLFKEEKSTSRWLEGNHHGLRWSSGEIPYEKLSKVLTLSLQNADKVYVKGSQKKNWIENIVPNAWILNVEHLGCPNFQQIARFPAEVTCSNHLPTLENPTCAIRNALRVRSWLRDTFKDVFCRDEAESFSYDVPDSLHLHRMAKKEAILSMFN